MEDNSYILRPIGYIRTPFKQKFGTPRQGNLCPSTWAEIELVSERAPEGALEGLESFSHLWVISWFHKNRPGHASGKVSPPRLQGEKMGLFATRSPHRPNPLGLSLAKIEKIDAQKRRLILSGIDLVDGTPIVDLKPYVQTYDYPPVSHSGWVNDLSDDFFQIEYLCSAAKLSPEEKSMIDECLRFDFRNNEDRQKDDLQKLYKAIIGRWDIHFRYRGRFVEIIDLIEEA